MSNTSTLTIDDTVVLSGATIDGGTIDDAGTLLVSGPSEIEKRHDQWRRRHHREQRDSWMR